MWMVSSAAFSISKVKIFEYKLTVSIIIYSTVFETMMW